MTHKILILELFWTKSWIFLESGHHFRHVRHGIVSRKRFLAHIFWWFSFLFEVSHRRENDSKVDQNCSQKVQLFCEKVGFSPQNCVLMSRNTFCAWKPRQDIIIWSNLVSRKWSGTKKTLFLLIPTPKTLKFVFCDPLKPCFRSKNRSKGW